MLFTFPSRYWFTIGRQRVFSLARWSSQIPTGFHVSRGTQGTGRSQRHVAYGAVTLSGRPFQALRLCRWLVTPCDRPYNPAVHARRFGLFRVRSPLLAESLLFSLPGGTEMVHFPPLPSHAYGFSEGYSSISRSGFPHSEIPGSKRVCRSPGLIAAYRVLHRLLAPRHSPYALSSLTTSVSNSHRCRSTAACPISS